MFKTSALFFSFKPKPNTVMAKNKKNLFEHFANWATNATGSPYAFIIAIGIIIIWGVTGPIFGYSDTWQLIINTGTTIITFLTVFLIQNTQNRDSKAIHLKLDEIIRSLDGARNQLIDLEDDNDEDIEKIKKEFNDIKIKLVKKNVNNQ